MLKAGREPADEIFDVLVVGSRVVFGFSGGLGSENGREF